MSLTGRAHHTHNDNLEMTFKNKEMLYRFLQKNVALEGDPFNYLHGRAANKFRLNEMNWHQTTPYYSLYYFTTGQKFSFTDQMINFENPDNWLVQLKNIKELKENPDGALKLTEMGSDVFPRKLVVTYLDINKKIVHSIPWKNTSLILVSAFVPDLMPVKFVQLDFEMDTSVHNYVNLLIDDNAEFGFAYSINYNLLEFTLDKVAQYPRKTYKGFFLVQNQYIYETKRNPNGRFKLLIELKAKYPNFSRIEIFATDKIMSEEELFPKEKGKP